MVSRIIRPIPEGTIQFVRMGDRQWRFEYTRLTEENHQSFCDALDTWHLGDPKTAERDLLVLVADLPEFIDAHHHLAMIQEELDKESDAIHRWETVCGHVLDLLPDDFYFGRDQLPWPVLENRPFLRAYHALGLSFMAMAEYRSAIGVFNDLLDLDSGDHQGARALAIDMHFRLRRPFDVLSVCARFPDDVMGETLYGRVLAWLQIGYLDEATQALGTAHGFLPRIAKELTKKSHRRPKILYPGRVIVGGADEAYYYWQEQGRYWRSTPGAIAFVGTFLASHTA